MKRATRLTGLVGLALLAGLPRMFAWQSGQVTSVTFTPPSPVTPGTTVTVTVAASGACGAIEINFGDGVVTTFPVTTLPLSQSHLYANVGSFTVTARGQGNCRGTVSGVLSVNKQGPGTAPPGSSPGGRLPDLELDILRMQPRVVVENTITYDVVVKNLGTSDAVNVAVRMQLSLWTDFVQVFQSSSSVFPSSAGMCRVSGQPGQASQPGSEFGQTVECMLNSLAAGGSQMIPVIVRPSPQTPDQTQIWFAAGVDPQNTIQESRETNNTAFAIATMISLADLQITTVFIQPTVTGGILPPPSRPTCGGANATTRVRILNNGPARSPATTVHVNWGAGVTSPTGASGDADCPSGQHCEVGVCEVGAPAPVCFNDCTVPPLMPGASTEMVFSFTAPGGRPANLGSAVVDPTSVVNDPNRNNNSVTVR